MTTRRVATVFGGGVYLPASVVGSNRLGSAGAAAELGLTPRLCEVLYYVCQGLPNKAIANRLGISEGTVRRDYVSDLLRFFKVARRTELIVEVARRGITISPPRVPSAPPSHRSCCCLSLSRSCSGLPADFFTTQPYQRRRRQARGKGDQRTERRHGQGDAQLQSRDCHAQRAGQHARHHHADERRR